MLDRTVLLQVLVDGRGIHSAMFFAVTLPTGGNSPSSHQTAALSLYLRSYMQG